MTNSFTVWVIPLKSYRNLQCETIFWNKHRSCYM